MINVKIPIPVVNLPNCFDFVQPAIEIIESSEMIPKKNVMTPITLGSIKSLLTTFKGYPTVVFINSVVIAKTLIKKKLAAKVEAIIIALDNLLLALETIRFATTAMEKPPRSELIVIVCSASLFQYSNVISVMCFVCFLISIFGNSTVLFFEIFHKFVNILQVIIE